MESTQLTLAETQSIILLQDFLGTFHFTCMVLLLVYLRTVHMQYLHRPEEGVRYPVAGCELAGGRWEPSWRPLEEQPEPGAAEPSLQPLYDLSAVTLPLPPPPTPEAQTFPAHMQFGLDVCCPPVICY